MDGSGVIAATLTNPSDLDWYEVELNAGDRLDLTSSRTAGGLPNISDLLYVARADENGSLEEPIELVTSTDGQEISFIASEASKYVVLFATTGASNTPLAYRLDWELTPSAVSVPTIDSISKVTSTSFEVSWSGIPDNAEEVEILVYRESGTEALFDTFFSDTTATSIVIDGLTGNTRYRVEIIARVDGAAVTSDPLRETTRLVAPATPAAATVNSVTAPNSTSLFVQWDGNGATNQDGYRIEVYSGPIVPANLVRTVPLGPDVAEDRR